MYIRIRKCPFLQYFNNSKRNWKYRRHKINHTVQGLVFNQKFSPNSFIFSIYPHVLHSYSTNKCILKTPDPHVLIHWSSWAENDFALLSFCDLKHFLKMLTQVLMTDGICVPVCHLSANRGCSATQIPSLHLPVLPFINTTTSARGQNVIYQT